MKTVFLRAIDASDKAATMRAAIREPESMHGLQRFEVDVASFASMPGSPFAYWVSERLLQLFTALPPLQSERRIATSGGKTLDDFRWIRLAWELIPGSRKTWIGYAKGGAYSKFYADVYLLIRWANDGEEPKAFLSAYRERKGWGTDWSACLNGYDHYFRPGLTWPRRTNVLSIRALPSGCIFADKGPAIFDENDDSDDLLALAAVTNSRVFEFFVSLRLGRTELARTFEVGLIQTTPFPRLSLIDRSTLAALGRRAWSLRRSLDSCTETSHAFTLPALSQIDGDTLSARANGWIQHIRTVESEMATIQAEIDSRCFDLYGIDEADRNPIIDGFGGAAESDELASTDADADGEADDESNVENGANATGLAAELMSWAVGVAFGRFDVRLAIGERALPREPEPFDALPACSPAMLVGNDGLPLINAPPDYPLPVPHDGLLADDPGHTRDLTSAVRAVFEVVFGDAADTIWRESAALLDPKDRNLRTWLAMDFSELHMKRHSRSRRKAPILWQLATPSRSYAVWMNSHRLTQDSLFQIQNDLVAPKLTHEERKHIALVQAVGPNPSASERREITAAELAVAELRIMLEEVKRVAPLWRPNLDDGVELNMAPLWRLVPHHKSWQKELKTAWDALCAGEYDWSHLAMYLWPERVVPKCAEDRSLAIAHKLEDVLWTEDFEGKWHRESNPTTSVAELVRERTSSAVKAALQSLLNAPSPGPGRGSSRAARRHGGDA